MAAVVRGAFAGDAELITLMYSNFAPSADHVRRLGSLVGPDRVAVVDCDAQAAAAGPSTRVVIGHRYLRQILPHAPHLQWVQTSAGGVDQLPLAELRSRKIVLTRNSLNAEAIAHHAIALAWSVMRCIPDAARAQDREVWATPGRMLAIPRRAMVLGLGSVGSEVARLLRGMGLHVRGVARTLTPERRRVCDELVDGVQWRAFLGDTDLLVLALALSTDTRGWLGPAEIALLPPGCIVVNVGRAGLVDMPALLCALGEGRIGGAATDVVDPKPGAGDPIWHTPGLLITPKVAAYHPAMQSRFEAFAEAQVQRFLVGQALEDVVNG